MEIAGALVFTELNPKKKRTDIKSKREEKSSKLSNLIRNDYPENIEEKKLKDFPSTPTPSPKKVLPQAENKKDKHKRKFFSRLKKYKKHNEATPLLILSITSAVLGSSVAFGYNFSVLNSPQEIIISDFNGNGTDERLPASFTTFQMSVAIAIHGVGGMLGALIAGFMVNHIGRKNSMLLNNIPIIVGGLLETVAVHPFMLIIGRFGVGLNNGASTVLVPVYLSEISPLRWRGIITSAHQLGTVAAILLVDILSLQEILGKPLYGWRILLGLTLLPAVFQLLTLPFCPESPRYLYIYKEDTEKAERALGMIRRTKDLSKELQYYEREKKEIQGKAKFKWLEIVKNGGMRRALFTSIGIHLSPHLAGIGAILYYSTAIFKAAKVPEPELATVFTGIALLLSTIFVTAIIDCVGRKKLMLYGLCGMGLSYTIITIGFCIQAYLYAKQGIFSVTWTNVLDVACIITVIVFYTVGPGPIPWVIISEFFTQEARPVAVGVSTVVHWFANAFIGLIFKFLLELYPFTLLIFAVNCYIFWIFTKFYVIETKGRPVDDVAREFQQYSDDRKWIHLKSDKHDNRY